MSMRIILAGDIHIGRSSSRIPAAIRRDGLRAEAAWRRIVDLAIEERASLVCLSGDIADKENKFWEAIGPLERGVERLAAAGVMTIAVSGNHDFDVLARLADQLPPEHFLLLGRGGKWERYTFRRDGRAVLHIDGWSFPRERVYESPLKSYHLERDPDTPILGLVHGDLDAAGSVYAPLEMDRLQALPPAGWLLGHIHAPRLLSSTKWVLYPGSPQALDFGEPGVHGIWTAEVSETLGLPEQQPISTVRYESITLDLTDAATETEVEASLLQQMRAESTRLAQESGPHVQCIHLRLKIVGRTPVSHRVEGIAKHLIDELALTAGEARVFVNRIHVATLPAIDVAIYAKAHSAPGAVARLLLALDQPELPPEVAPLLARTKRELEQIQDHKHFAALEPREITDELAREHLRDRSMALLTQLVGQTS